MTEKLVASKEQINELLEFIGGFEQWSVLPEVCRREVVKYSDYKSRFNLGVCSKNDLETVKNTPIHVEKVSIEGGRIVMVKVKFNKKVRLNQEFTQDSHSPNPYSDNHKKAVKFAEKWIKKANFKLNGIVIKMTNYPVETSEIKSLSHCKTARLHIDDLDSLNWLIGKLPERVDKLEIQSFCSEFFTVPYNILCTPQIMQASTLYIIGRAEFTDEQFLKLGAKVLWFEPVNVTAHGFKQYIKNWMAGKGMEGFKLLRLKANMNWDLNAMMRILGAREWDEAFEAEAPDFVKVFRRNTKGQCFQIQSRCVPFESLTLNVDEYAVRVFATGFEGESDGKPCQDYKQPSYYW